MIEERFLLVALLIGLVVALGQLVSRWNRRRNRRLAATVRIDVSGELPNILSFTGPGCDACAVQSEILDDLANWAEIRRVDCIQEHELAKRFGVWVVPTTVVTARDGRIVGINTGLTSADALLAQIARAA